MTSVRSFRRMMPRVASAARLALFGALLPVRICCFAAQPAGADLESVFRNPPESARAMVFWYWMREAVSKEGITADLEAMKAVGIAGAHLVPLASASDPPDLSPPVKQLTPEGWEHIRFALAEADRLGLKIAMHASDGFATAGGPWITPELSMQKVVWSTTHLEGGGRRAITLPQPETNEGFYKDIAVFAYPAAKGGGIDSFTKTPRVTTSVPDADASFLSRQQTDETFTSNEGCWIQYTFDEPFTARALTVRLARTKGIQNATYWANRLIVEVSDDGVEFRRLTRLEPPRHGWQDGDADVTHALPEATARVWRFIHDPSGGEAGAEDLDSAKWNPRLRIQGLDMLDEVRLHQFEGKTGHVFRVSPRTDPALVPDADCVPLDRIIELTPSMSAAGQIEWDAPAGRWTILRMGHTSTGYRNESAGNGKGLECDKFNPEAARAIFDGWFAEIFRQAGEDLAGRVLKVFHVDSWECGSQNWSPVFRDEFIRRRGYDPIRHLPAMAGIPIESADVSERFLRDVRETIAELIVDNFYGVFAKLAREKGCVFSSECVAPVMTADGLSFFDKVDVPMGEFWLRSATHDKINDMLDAISGARIYGKNIVQAEAFTQIRLAWDETPAGIKTLGDFNYALGANRFVYHVFTHNPWTDRAPGMTLGGVGLYFQRDQAWWKPGRAWVEYAERCQALLQQGAPVVDLAVFTGEEIPRRAVVPWRLAPAFPAFFPQDDARLKKQIIETADWANPLSGYAYDSINPDALVRLAEARGGRLVLPGGGSYAALVLPAIDSMMPVADRVSPAVLRKALEFVRGGGTVILGQRPVAAPGLARQPGDDQEASRLADELWPREMPAGSAREVGEGRVFAGPYPDASFDGLGLAPDFRAEEDGAPAEALAWTHRRGGDWDLYFVSNQRQETRRLRLSLRAKGAAPELWDPVTTRMRVARGWRMDGDRTTLPLTLPPGGSTFVVIRADAPTPGVGDAAAWDERTLALALDGPWQVEFDPARGGPAGPVEFARLESWTAAADAGIRHYSGTAAYVMHFDWSEAPEANRRVWLDLGSVADLAGVALNGVDCGVAWAAPYAVDVTDALRKGGNLLRIQISNTWFNRLAGDRVLPESERVTWTTAPERTEGRPLLPAGLLGPVTLQIETITSGM